jgi:hypothetical protein
MTRNLVQRAFANHETTTSTVAITQRTNATISGLLRNGIDVTPN